MFELSNLDSIQIGMASPEQILAWSHGEVTKPETINYRTLKPERDGLYCERIFGPTKDWECNCGKYKRIKFKDKDKICDKCGVQVTRAKVRRERMGHIQLAAPVSHIWYFKGIPSRMGMLLDISPRNLEKVLYFANFIVLDPGNSEETGLKRLELINDARYREVEAKCGKGSFVAKMGAEAVQDLLKELDLEKLSADLKAEIAQLTEKERDRETEGQKRARAVKRLEVVESFRTSHNKPEWMILSVVPVIPPDLRPLIQLDGGRFATSDLNDLYRRVINRNNRLKRLLELGAPDIIVRNEKRMLQESVDALIDNGRRGRPVTGPGNRALKSLSDLLRGKQGRFRQNLLGKRVDYSGRSVIVVGPELKLYQCGLPKEMALELFKPFVMERLVSLKLSHNVKSAKRAVEKVRPEVWDILEEVIRDHPVLLNRAPTLHRLGIQAFEPILVEGKAIKLHPLACTAFNADFDGDQMAVHVPLSMEAQAEARFLMLAHNNILKPQDGRPVISPSQDMVIGCYYLTIVHEGALGSGRVFSSEDEAIMAYSLGQITLQSPIKVRIFRTFGEESGSKLIDTTLGRLIFNDALPQNLGFVKRECLDDMFKLEIDELVGKKQLSKIVDQCFHTQGEHKTAQVLDKIKALGFKYSTVGAITVSVADIKVPEVKKTMLEEADEAVRKVNALYRKGLLSEDERYNRVINIWTECTANLKNQILPNLDKFNPIRMMTDSGARGSSAQVSQLAGMRGLMASPSGKTIELPIRANFREGLTVLEFFLSSHGSRKSLADTALRTADSGYLTRRLVDVSQEVIVREDDCFESRGEKVRGISVAELMSGKQSIESLEDRLRGRTAAEDIVDPATGEVLVRLNEPIDYQMAREIVARGITKATVRSVLTCRTENGVCARCYGENMAHGGKVDVGEAVGIIAAQAIGEPGTQLTMRTFHTGGIAGADDITQGLPRVEELFEARKPKRDAILAEIAGTVSIQETKKRRELVITSDEDPKDTKAYQITYGSRLKVSVGDHVEAGDELTEGSVNPHDLLRILGVKAVQEYLLKEVLSVYRLQGVGVSDKHIEIIIRQMLRKVRVEDSGDTDLLTGSLVDIFHFEEANRKAIMEGGTPAIAKRILLGITKASLATESFLSAASFQETTRVLTEAAIRGKIDPLIGLKENVILGKLIPAGTGMKRYKDIEIKDSYSF
ncbi:DNA-directed RNA polymerase subunit beta' [Aristaeella hokkaidonensis]|uniref:DNA-directed RNA polymerase subunit beta n=1 Tax=Aristaeella hokkaidonensis TaxID=3046382 RepID=A0AC61NCA3_9FIRM|nr:DNA-directed RNA polymerase subunit beta' [Aristaeella hokkaidonensis]QUC68291.1 DNA-directed RNA polymerase subunit beta' [Aristaeella hokkaidonensis]SNT95317.1 DNA-directed RNA polymerase subunit beta' [Aristaeella hokkaidonensis]